MKIAICGPGESGKDTAADWLADNTSLRFGGSTSAYAALIVAAVLCPLHGYRSVTECFADRRNHREEWARIIADYNRPDGLTLYREILAETGLLVGVRRADEWAAVRAAGLIDLAVWIERPSAPPDPTCELTEQDCDVTIVNDGTVDDLFAQLRALAASWRLLV